MKPTVPRLTFRPTFLNNRGNRRRFHVQLCAKPFPHPQAAEPDPAECRRAAEPDLSTISKRETGQSLPDLEQLTKLADLLCVSADTLLSHTPRIPSGQYQRRYDQEIYYWGLAPSSMCYEVMRQLPPTRPLRVLDVGCGEGKDAVFFARNGYEVTAFDIAESGLDKTLRLADVCGVSVNLFRADVLTSARTASTTSCSPRACCKHSGTAAGRDHRQLSGAHRARRSVGNRKGKALKSVNHQRFPFRSIFTANYTSEKLTIQRPRRTI